MLATNLKSVFWGIILGVLGASWLYGAIYPSPGESRLLFSILGIGGLVGSGFCLSPKLTTKLFNWIGLGIKWAYILGVVILIIAGIVSIFVGAPIPAAIIVGSLIIASAISQQESG